MSEFNVVIVDDPNALIVEVDTGIKGEVGPQGPAGQGVPVGGTAGQVLTKQSATNYDATWVDPTGAVLSVNGQTGVVVLDKGDIGLGDVDNTSDADKPISTATQLALDGKQDELAFTPEDVANKSTNTSLGTSNTLYPSQNAVKTYVDTAVAGATIPDATTLVKGKVKLAGDLSGTADLPTVPGLAGKFDIPTGLATDYLDGTGAPQPFPDVVLESTFDEYNLLQKEPTGFQNRTDSTIAFNSGTREFSIAPAVSSFDVYVKGSKFTKTTTQTVTIPSLDGNHYIYFDQAGTLQSTQAIGPEIFQDNAFVSIIYWNTTNSSAVYFAEERHGLVMDGATHGYLHTVFGARYLSGFALQGFSVDGDGNSNAQAQFTSDSGSFRDEDLLIQALAQSQIPILYKSGLLWRKKAADSFPVIYSGTAGYTGANGRLAFNELSGGTWGLSEVPNNNFVLVHFFATNDVNNPIVGIQGITTYNSISGARTGAISEIGALTGLPFAEFLAIGSVIFETANTYTNTPKAVVRSTDTGGNYVDFRGTQSYTPAYGSASSHSLLSNLSSDDHLQYHNDARGDARYYTKAQVDSSLASKEDVANKSTNTALGTSDTLYPSQNAVKSYVDAKATFSDSTFRIQDNTDPTKQIAFEAGSISSGQTRTLTSPNASGRIQVEGQAIGDTTPANGTFTTLTGSTKIVGPQGASVGSSSDVALSIGQPDTGFTVVSNSPFFWRDGFQIWWASPDKEFVASGAGGVKITGANAPLVMPNNIALHPDANGELHQRKDGQAQGHFIYNTYTSGSNFERAFMRWNTNRFEIGTDEAGVGQHRPIRLLQNGYTRIELNEQVYLWNEVNGRTKLTSNSGANQTRDLAFPDVSGTLAIESYTPGPGDNYEIQSYNRFLNGSASLDAYPSGGKWQQIAFSGSPNWANLRLCFATVNGKTLPQSMIGQESYVDSSTYYEVDFGWGLAPGNYSDFINSLMGQLNQNTQLYSRADLAWAADYYTTDSFFLVFEETAFIDDGMGANTIQTPIYFSIQTNGPVLADNFGSSMNEMVPNYSVNTKNWTIV